MNETVNYKYYKEVLITLKQSERNNWICGITTYVASLSYVFNWKPHFSILYLIRHTSYYSQEKDFLLINGNFSNNLHNYLTFLSFKCYADSNAGFPLLLSNISMCYSIFKFLKVLRTICAPNYFIWLYININSTRD